jgi:zinc protease
MRVHRALLDLLLDPKTLLRCLLLAPSTLSAGPADFRRVVLDNGLTVLLQEDHRAPLVSVGIMYAAGARNEAAGQTGIAHYVEHMNFRASARFPGSENTESITRLGGRWNGYTWIDQTYYAATVPREALGLALDIEADRMTAAVFDPREFEKERTSVIAELRSYDDPQSLLYDAVMAASFTLHPYRNNTIGWLTDVEQITRDEAFRFYRRFYRPGNAVLAIVGDVEAAGAVEEVRRRFGSIPRGGETSDVRTVEPGQSGQRRVVLRLPGPHALVMAAWRAPALRDADFPVMVLFDALLAGGKGFYFTHDYAPPARTPLQRALVDAGLGTRVGSDWQASRYPYAYTLQAAVPRAEGLGAAEEALLRAVSEAAARDWTEEEMRAARRQIRSGWAADLDELAGRAHQLAFFEVSGGAESLGTLPEQLDRVTTDDLRRFARERLRTEQSTVGWFVPAAEPERTADSAAAQGSPAAASPSPTQPVVGPAAKPTAGAAEPPARAGEASASPAPAPPVSFTLANGVRVEVLPGVGAGMVALRARLDVGPPEDATEAALGALLTERLARPAGGEPTAPAGLAFTLHDEPEAFSNFRWIEVSARGLAGDARDLLAVLARRLDETARPLDDAAWAALVKAAQERAREHAGSPETALWARALAELYPPGSGLAGPPWGAAETLGARGAERLLAFARDRAQPARMQVALAGAIDAATAREAVARTLGRWRPSTPRTGPPSPAHAAPPRGPGQWTERVVSQPDKGQDDILVVWPGERATVADRAATKALLYLLGETGYAGRLGEALVGPGLAYSVYTTLREAPGAPGFLAVRTASSRADARETLRRIREVLEGAARGTFTQAELQEAKTYLRGRDLLRRGGSDDVAARALERATDPPGLDPEVLTLAQLNATARRLFERGAPLALVLGPGLD